MPSTRKNAIRFTAAAALCLILFTSARVSAEPIEIRYHLETGKTYNVVMKDHQVVKTSALGNDAVENRIIETSYAFRVDSVDTAGSYRMTGRITRLAIKFDNPNVPIDFDTDGDPVRDTQAARTMRPVVDVPFTLTLSPLGEIAGVRGLDEVIEKVRGEVNPNDPAAGVALLLLEQAFTDQSITGVLHGALPRYPQEAVEVGQSWTSVDTIVIGGPQKVTSSMTLTGADTETLAFSSSQRLEPTGSVEPMKVPGGLEIVADLAGEGTSEIQADARTGWIIQISSKSVLKGDTEIFGDALPEAMIIPTEVESESTITGAASD